MNAEWYLVMYHSTPQELKITGLDPKKQEFATYKDLPFCPIDPVTDMNDDKACYLIYVGNGQKI